MNATLSIDVSIVIPEIAGDSSLLDGTLKSIHAQTCGAWELIQVGADRNVGIAQARAPFLLFLEAGDLLHPEHLERLVGAMVAGEGLDCALCGWRYIDSGGHEGPEHPCPAEEDLFPPLAASPLFPAGACVVRKSRVEAVGGFDSDLPLCGEWALWQRIARSGAGFGRLPEPLAGCRLRPEGPDPEAVFLEGLEVIARAHAADPRVPSPVPVHAEGRPPAELEPARLRFAAWCAGLALGRGSDPRVILRQLGDPPELLAGGLDPGSIAQLFARAIPLAAGRTEDAWGDVWPRVEGGLDAFLGLLETVTGVGRLARRVRTVLERVAAGKSAQRPLSLGRLHAIRRELTEPLGDFSAPSPAIERLRCDLTLDGEALGAIELPVADGRVSAVVLADAAAGRFAQPIFERFLASSGRSPAPGDFLRDLWGRPDWPKENFYDAAAATEEAPIQSPWEGVLAVEVSSDLPAVSAAEPFEIAVRVGGVALGAFRLPAGAWGPQALRALITGAAGIELCRVAVREGILGQRLDSPGTLRERLVMVARTAEVEESGPGLKDAGIVFARHRGGVTTAVSRRADLPAEAIEDLLASAAAAGEPVFGAPGEGASARVSYAPELLWKGCGEEFAGPGAPTAPALRARGPFEALFASAEDPWEYGRSAYEENKYRQILELLPARKFRKALEIGCAEGHFTALLAPRVEELVAADVSRIALERAARRCRDLANVSLLRLDLMLDPFPSGLDLLIVGEVLYYVPGLADLRVVARKLTAALAPGGYLVSAHAHILVDDPESTGFDWGLPFGGKVIGEVLGESAGLHLARELRTPLYRIQLFRRGRRPAGSARFEEATELPPLSPRVAATVRWGGGRPSAPSILPEPVTRRLPILLYHSVAPEGPAAQARFRISPDRFEEQLLFLRDAGYYTPRLADWRRAVMARQPLPGKAVLLTFDDGYVDFAEFAWPLLRKYSFQALVFLVADAIGKTSGWNAAEDALPLLGWEQIRALQVEGVELGSHSARHPALTGLTPVEIVREAARSRALLTGGLGRPVEAFAYPHGDFDPTVAHLVGACGYLYGLTSHPGYAKGDDPLLALPRIEVAGGDDFARFVRNVTGRE